MARKTASRAARKRPLGRTRNYTVGKGKPPVEHQIQPGERRNPTGRRGKTPKPQKTMNDFLNEKVRGSKYTLRETIYAQAVTRAASGEIAYIRLVLEHDELLLGGDRAPDMFKFDPAKAQKILAAFKADTEKKLRKKLTGGDGDE